MGLEIFLGIGALFGGAQFIIAPDGHLLGITTRELAGTSFPSYLVPGIILVFLAGVGSLAWAFYLALGCGITALGIVWWRGSPAPGK